MFLKDNPFYILNLPCTATRREVVEAAEKTSFFADNPTSCFNAQSALINPAKRLKAELNWFIDVEGDQLDNIICAIKNGERLESWMFGPLSKLNADIYNFALSDEQDYYRIAFAIAGLDKQYCNLDSDQILIQVNKNREKSHFAVVENAELLAEINNKRIIIRDIISDKLSCLNKDNYVEIVTLIADSCISRSGYIDGDILSDLVDQYEIRIQSELEEKTDIITESIKSIKESDNYGSIPNKIIALIDSVKEWDKLAQPIQLKAQASGMAHKISENLGYELRDLAIYIHNERSLTKEALTLVEALREVFAELDELTEVFDEDKEKLNDILNNNGIVEKIINDCASVEKMAKRINRNSEERYVDAALVKDFLARAISLKKKLETVLSNASSDDKEVILSCKTLIEKLFYMVRNVAIELNNKANQPQSAKAILDTLAEEYKNNNVLSSKLTLDLFLINNIVSNRNEQKERFNAAARTRNVSPTNNNKHGCLVWVIVSIVALVIILALSLSGSKNSKAGNSNTKNTYSNVSRIDGSTDLKPVDVKNGFIKKPSGVLEAPVTVHAPKDESCYVYFKCSGIPEKDFSIFVSAGKTIKVFAPIGGYTMYYASGTVWYGVDHKFGSGTKYYRSYYPFIFTKSDDYVFGTEVTLYSVSNGNMETSTISEDSFPG